MKRHPKRNPRRLADLSARLKHADTERVKREAVECSAFKGGGQEQPGFAEGHVKIDRAKR